MSYLLNFFMGATTPDGFLGYFDTLPGEGYRLNIIKSGPGCGKSTMMKRIAERLGSAGEDVELIHCSSDPDSLDGTLCRTKGFAIIDGTAPHIVEPSIPGADERVVSMYGFLDEGMLRPALGELKVLFADNAACHARARRFTSSVCSLLSDTERIAGTYIDLRRLGRYSAGLCARLITKKQGARGTTRLRLQSAITPRGIVSYARDNLGQFQKVYVFDDRFGAAAHRILAAIRDYAEASGCDATVCLSPFDRELVDAVYIPSQSLAFCISSRACPAGRAGTVSVHCRRFYDLPALDKRKNRLDFELRCALELARAQGEVMNDALEIHDRIEEFYKASVDFDAVTRTCESICRDLGV